MNKFIFLAIFLVGTVLDVQYVCGAKGRSHGKSMGSGALVASAIRADSKDPQQQPQQPQQTQSQQLPLDGKSFVGKNSGKSNTTVETQWNKIMDALDQYPCAWRMNALMNRWTCYGPTLNLCPRPFVISA